MKFKGKRISDGHWIYWDITTTVDMDSIDKKTICQYIHYLDHDKKEIYTNDIISRPERKTVEVEPLKYTIKFVPEYFKYFAIDRFGQKVSIPYLIEHLGCVVGNESD